MDKILTIFDYLPISTWTFFTLNVDKKKHYLTPYPPHLFHVVFEWPLNLQRPCLQNARIFTGLLHLLVHDLCIWSLYTINVITTGRYIVKTHQCVTKEVTTSSSLNSGMPELGGGAGGARHPDFLNRGGERLCPHISTRPPNFQTFQHPCSSSKLELHAKPVSLLITINSSLALGCGACVLLWLCFGIVLKLPYFPIDLNSI